MRSAPPVASTVSRTATLRGRWREQEVSCRYNQAEGGLVCFDAENQSCSSDCHFCNQLSASVVFDTEKLTMVEKVGVFVQNAASAPRAWTVSYSFEGPLGPWTTFGSYEMTELAEGEIAVAERLGNVVAARYWKVEITLSVRKPSSS